MKMSAKGRSLLTLWEGKKNKVYLDSEGSPTLGVGHLLTPEELRTERLTLFHEVIKYKEGLTDLQVDQLLSQDLLFVEDMLNNSIMVPLNQDQFDALCSFAFNIGNAQFLKSTLRRNLNLRDYAGVPFQLRRWNKSEGQVSKGLTNRRENEVKLFEGQL